MLEHTDFLPACVVLCEAEVWRELSGELRSALLNALVTLAASRTGFLYLVRQRQLFSMLVQTLCHNLPLKQPVDVLDDFPSLAVLLQHATTQRLLSNTPSLEAYIALFASGIHQDVDGLPSRVGVVLIHRRQVLTHIDALLAMEAFQISQSENSIGACIEHVTCLLQLSTKSASLDALQTLSRQFLLLPWMVETLAGCEASESETLPTERTASSTAAMSCKDTLKYYVMTLASVLLEGSPLGLSPASSRQLFDITNRERSGLRWLTKRLSLLRTLLATAAPKPGDSIKTLLTGLQRCSGIKEVFQVSSIAKATSALVLLKRALRKTPSLVTDFVALNGFGLVVNYLELLGRRALAHRQRALKALKNALDLLRAVTFLAMHQLPASLYHPERLSKALLGLHTQLLPTASSVTLTYVEGIYLRQGLLRSIEDTFRLLTSPLR